MIPGFAISGRAASGKSSFASLLTAALTMHGIESRICPFAEDLKREVFELYGVTKSDPGGRERLIEHGEGRRADDPRYWVYGVERRVHELRAEGAVPIIDDLRFKRAEWAWVNDCGFTTIRTDAPLAVRAARLLARGADPQFAQSMIPGESQLDWVDHDYCVQSHGDPKWMEVMARSLVAEAVRHHQADTALV